jgi:hypothetical protein
MKQVRKAPLHFSKKRPTLLYDNGHGTKIVGWDEGRRVGGVW